MFMSVCGASGKRLLIFDSEIKVNDVIHMPTTGDIISLHTYYYVYKWGMKGDFKGSMETSSCENLSFASFKQGMDSEVYLVGGTKGIVDVFLNQVIAMHLVLN